MSSMSNPPVQSWQGQQQDVIKLPPRPTHLPRDGEHLVRTDTDGGRENINMSGPDTALEVVQWGTSAASSRSVSSGMWCQALYPAVGDSGFQPPDYTTTRRKREYCACLSAMNSDHAHLATWWQGLRRKLCSYVPRHCCSDQKLLCYSDHSCKFV